jgi:Zn-dependent peptidase ImmA (M78 family)
MKADHTDLARRLIGRLEPSLVSAIAEDPMTAIRTTGVRVEKLEISAMSAECTCDGAYFPYPRPMIGYTSTPHSRREHFTVVHEFGHHEVRCDDDVLSTIADMGEDGGLVAEERVCDAFAGRILVPDEVLDDVLEGRRPEAADLITLYQSSLGSREACAVRLANRIGCFGYVALLDPDTRTVRFASASESCPYVWRRGSGLPRAHPAWRARGSGSFRGEGEVVWQDGRKNLWMDAVSDGNVIVAIFVEDKYWKAEGLSILAEEAVTKARGISLSGTCRHCGENTWGYRACSTCGDVICRSCKKCGCGAPPPTERECTKCFMIKSKAQFVGGSTVCRDCAG